MTRKIELTSPQALCAEVARAIPLVFSAWPAKRPPVFYFDRTEGLARVGVPNVDEIEFGMTAERAISLMVDPLQSSRQAADRARDE